MIKTVIFDIGNVLTRFGWKEYFAAGGYDRETQDRLAKATVLSDDWREYDLGNLTDEEVLARFIENDPGLADILHKCFTNIKGLLTPFDYAIPWVQELKEKGFKVLYLSNFSEIALRDCSEVLGFIPYMDGGIFSCRVHLIKPDPAIYKLLLTQYSLQAEECVFLDDTLENIEAARALGIHGIHFTDKERADKELAELGV